MLFQLVSVVIIAVMVGSSSLKSTLASRSLQIALQTRELCKRIRLNGNSSHDLDVRQLSRFLKRFGRLSTAVRELILGLTFFISAVSFGVVAAVCIQLDSLSTFESTCSIGIVGLLGVGVWCHLAALFNTRDELRCGVETLLMEAIVISELVKDSGLKSCVELRKTIQSLVSCWDVLQNEA